MNEEQAFLRSGFVALGFFLFLSLTTPAAFALYATNTTVFAKEFWISTNTDSENLGTADNPFICATAPEFDRTMSNMPPYSTVHILAGNYQTVGGDIHAAYALKSGQKILGSGIDNTIIQLVTKAPSGNCVMGSVGRAADIEVSDLTLDCHYQPGVSGTVTYHGLDLNGSHIAVRRVKVINLVYLDSTVNSEAFGIGINSTYGGTFNSERNIIEECEVSNFMAGTSCSAIVLNGGCISGILCNNHVYLHGSASELIAFNGGDMHDVLVEGNYVDGGGTATAFYGDAGGYTNVTVAHNTFNNCEYGVSLGFVPRQNLTFSFNTFKVPAGGICFVFNPNTSFTNIVITGNDILFDGQASTGSLFLDANNITGLIVNNNTVDPRLTNVISGCSGVNIYNNYDLNGNLLVMPSLNQVRPPAGITRTTVTNTTYYVSYTDEYIGVQTIIEPRVIFLPSAVACPGKTIIVDDESGTASETFPIEIIASTKPPCTINGGSVISITSHYGAKTIVSDGANWFAH